MYFVRHDQRLVKAAWSMWFYPSLRWFLKDADKCNDASKLFLSHRSYLYTFDVITFNTTYKLKYNK